MRFCSDLQEKQSLMKTKAVGPIKAAPRLLSNKTCRQRADTVQPPCSTTEEKPTAQESLFFPYQKNTHRCKTEIPTMIVAIAGGDRCVAKLDSSAHKVKLRDRNATRYGVYLGSKVWNRASRDLHDYRLVTRSCNSSLLGRPLQGPPPLWRPSAVPHDPFTVCTSRSLTQRAISPMSVTSDTSNDDISFAGKEVGLRGVSRVMKPRFGPKFTTQHPHFNGSKCMHHMLSTDERIFLEAAARLATYGKSNYFVEGRGAGSLVELG
jgi:hypothetical protein